MRLGIFLGMFDPMHRGHVAVAGAALGQGIAEVVLTPLAAPLSGGDGYASGTERLSMCRLTIGNEKHIHVSDCALNEMRPLAEVVSELQCTYRAETVTLIVENHRFHDLVSRNDRLNELCDVLCYPCLPKDIPFGWRVQELSMPGELSDSADIRAMLSRYEDAPALFPEEASYIAENGLYHDASLLTVREHMSEKRFRHTLGVRHEAVRLALMHEISLQKAAQAAMLHDCAKGLPFDEMLHLAQKAGIVDADVLSSPAMLHGPVAAFIARTEYGVTDVDVLNAITYHTVGRTHMTALELCIFVADATEPGREHYPGLKRLRKLSEQSLSAAALLSLNLTKEYVLSKGGTFNRLSEATIAWLQTVVPASLLQQTKA